jgi:flagellar hook capping protein FlgD
MRHITGLLLICTLALAPRGATAQSGGPFSLSWSAVGAGGATSTGASLSLNGSVASWSAGAASGGSFRLEGGWSGTTSSVGVPDPSPLPTAFAWLPAYPNPFTRRTAFGFAMPRGGHVLLEAFDLSGRRVRTFVNAELAPGRHHLEWDGTDDHGARLPSGIYFVHLDAGDLHTSSRIVLVH